MTKSEMIDAVIQEMDRVWVNNGFDGSPEQYEWLLKNYNISEEDDVKWQLIMEHHMDDLCTEDQNDDDVMAFLENTISVNRFLQEFLTKYRSSSKSYKPQN